MGSATLNNITNMDEKKKSIKGLIKNIFGKKKDKDDLHKKENKNIDKDTIKQKDPIAIKPTNTVETILANLKNLEINSKNEENDELKNFSFKTVQDNELDNFTVKIVEDERRTERTDSHSSQDSGFADNDTDGKCDDDDDVIKQPENEENDKKGSTNDDKNTEEESEEKATKIEINEEDVVKNLENLKLDEGKKKKTHILMLSRTPIRNKVVDYIPLSHPYGQDATENAFRQINQVNKHTLSGGNVTECKHDFVQEVHKDTTEELQNFSNGLAMRGVELNGQPFELELIQEYLDEKAIQEPNNILEEFIQDPINSEHVQTITTLVEKHMEAEAQNPIQELESLETTNHLNYEQIANLDSLIGYEEDKLYTNMYPTPPSTDPAYSPRSEQFYSNFLTPPRSEVASSPLSDSTLYPTNSECILSPNSDCEKYQDIPQYYDEIPNVSEHEDTDKKARERNTSTSSMSMKNFKDLQRELAGNFSKKECCHIDRKTCKQLFYEHMKKLKAEERRTLSMKVASIDLEAAYGVLQQILLSISRGTPDEDLHLTLFALVCERVLGQKALLFAGDFGLGVLKAAALRCPHLPLLSRYVVQCIRTAVRLHPDIVIGKECLFKEVDAQGDTLATACARGGDTYADVLSEIVRTEHGDIPLFNLQHGNTEGYSALHVACRQHSSSSPSAHTVHVLLEHGGADIWKGDAKGGDTAVHMAVNSATSELRLVLLLFRHLDRKMWKKLAHVPNRSSVTPLDYARCAAKSTTRQNYPTEILDFLKKCR